MKFNIYIKINTSLITISFLIWLLFSSTQKNLYKLINYIRLIINLVRLKIISCLNLAFFIINVDLVLA